MTKRKTVRTPIVRISKEVEWDAGHRVPAHASKCKHPHGHRYKLRATCVGHIVTEKDAPDEGMLIDFSHLKKFMMEEVHDVLDHGFIVHEGDSVMRAALSADSGWNIIVFPTVPTAENIAVWCWEKLEPLIRKHFRGNLVLEEVAVWETPTSVAYYNGVQIERAR